jgi:hypothetical protein
MNKTRTSWQIKLELQRFKRVEKKIYNPRANDMRCSLFGIKVNPYTDIKVLSNLLGRR